MPALADTVQMRYRSVGLSRIVSVSGSVFNGRVYAGELRHEFSGGLGEAAQLTGILPTFCTELSENVNTSWRTFTLAEPADAPAPGDGMGAIRAAALENLYAGAAGQQHTSANWAAAFQMAVWEIVNDFDGTAASINTAAGSVRFNSNQAWFTTVASMVNGAMRSLALSHQRHDGLHAVTNIGAQDQLVVLVPLPGPAAMGAAGLLCLVGWRYRRARGHDRD